MEYAIEINHLEKTFKKESSPAVKDLSLKIKEGELYGLLGVNGAGKSTAIKMLSCLIKPSKGDALIEGHSILKEPEIVKDLSSYSPQESAVATNLTVEENLTFMANVYGMKKNEAKRKVEEMLNSLDLVSVRKKKVSKLS